MSAVILTTRRSAQNTSRCAGALEHRGLLVRELDSDVFELIGSEGRFRRRS
jgi:hypothetical protein